MSETIKLDRHSGVEGWGWVLKWMMERHSHRERPTVSHTNRSWLLLAHLVPYGFLGWEVEGVYLWKLRSQVIVELPELGVTPIHIPLVVQDTDIHLRT